MTDRLSIAADLDLPQPAFEDVVAILGRRGRGKTTTAAVTVEELHAAGARFCVVDPVGVWWGLKSSKDGKRPGIPVVVLGGDHGDVPLGADAGEIIADFVADETSPSCVLDLQRFTHGELVRFMTAFLERLYHRNKRPLHLVLDEADQFAPQRAAPAEARMLGAAERVCKMGRAKGLHPMLITQRPATLNKNVLTQAGLLIAHALTGPQDRKAVDEWIRSNAEEGQRDQFLANLASLPRGTAWFWSPDLPLFRQVEVRDRETFDSSSTPEQGGLRAQPKALAQVDLKALEARIASTIEKAKAEDPRELRKTISDLRAQLSAAATVVKPAPAPKAVPIIPSKTADVLLASVDRLREVAGKTKDLAERILAAFQAANDNALAEATHALRATQASARPAAPLSPKRTLAPVGDDQVGKGGLRRILVALAQRPNGLSARQLGVRARLSSKSGTFDTYLSRGRAQGWIAGDRDRLLLTDAGLEAIGHFQDLPSGRELLEHWLRELGGGGAARILRVLADAYPRALTRQDLATAADLAPGSGTFDTYLSRLRSLELVEGRAEVRMSEELA